MMSCGSCFRYVLLNLFRLLIMGIIVCSINGMVLDSTCLCQVRCWVIIKMGSLSLWLFNRINEMLQVYQIILLYCTSTWHLLGSSMWRQHLKIIIVSSDILRYWTWNSARLLCIFKYCFYLSFSRKGICSCIIHSLLLSLCSTLCLIFIDHLNKYLFCILQTLVHARVFAFKIATQWKFLDLLFGVDKSNYAISTTQD